MKSIVLGQDLRITKTAESRSAISCKNTPRNIVLKN